MSLMKNLGYYNGKCDLIENITVPMSDRVCWFGDGVYDATATRNGVIYCLDEHIDRFFNSAAMIEIEIPYTKWIQARRMGKHFYTGRLQEEQTFRVIMFFQQEPSQVFG